MGRGDKERQSLSVLRLVRDSVLLGLPYPSRLLKFEPVFEMSGAVVEIGRDLIRVLMTKPAVTGLSLANRV